MKCLERITIKNYLLILLIFQLLWFLLLFPGCVSYDSYNQIAQAVGWIPFMDNNPIFHSMIMATIIRPIYLCCHNVNVCIAIWNIISNTYYFLVVFYAITVFKCYYNRYNLVKVLFLFYVACPLVWGFWSILWKDVWISYSVLLLSVSLIDLLYITKYDMFIKDSFKLVVLFIACMLTLISKGTGILFVIPVALALFFYYKKVNKVVYIALFSIILYYGSLLFVTKMLGFQEHGNTDFLCLLWQMLGNIIKENDISHTSEFILVKDFFDIEKAKILYNPYIADPIKDALNIEKFNINIIRNSIALISLCIRFYKSSLKAIVFMMMGYLSPTFYTNSICTNSYLQTVYLYANTRWQIDFDPQSSYITSEVFHSGTRSLISNIYSGFKYVPVISYLFNIGFYNTMWIVCYIICRIRSKSVLIYIIPLFCLISCVASPVSGEWRYAYPMVLIIPIVVIYTLYLEGAYDK